MLVNYSINHPFNPWCFYRCWWMQGEQWGLCSRMQEHKRIIRLHLSIRIPAWCWSKVVHWWVMTTSVSMSNSADRQTDSFLTRWFTCSFTYSLTSTLTNSLTNSLTHSITHSLAEWLTHWLIDISTQYVSVCASVSVCVCLCLCLPVCVSISLQVYLFNHLFVSRSICLCLFLCYGSTKMRKLWFQCSFLLEFSPDITPIIYKIYCVFSTRWPHVYSYWYPQTTTRRSRAFTSSILLYDNFIERFKTFRTDLLSWRKALLVGRTLSAHYRGRAEQFCIVTSLVYHIL